MAAMGIEGQHTNARNSRFAEYLFYSHSYKTEPGPKRVAIRLRRFIRKIEGIRARDRRKMAAPMPSRNNVEAGVQRKLELVA